MNTKVLNTGEVIHDFRPHKLRWGWNGLSWSVSDDRKSAQMLGVGKGLEVGHFIALNHGGEDCGYKIESIEYLSNPKDMFNATVSGVYEFEEGELD